MDLGIDLGTSSAKAVVLDEAGVAVAEASAPIAISRPRPLWSEQNPADWLAAATAAVRGLPEAARARVRAIGLSGQMHGATLLGADDRPLRPAILWNDGRSFAECASIEAAEPRSRAITGNLAMPGFTAPKLAWVRAHEPAAFAATRTVLLPKDYLRLFLTGEKASDMSDAAGTLWLDVGARAWSEAMLAATGLNPSHMPRLVEGSEVSGRLTAGAAAELGLAADIPVAGGGGDNAASAVGAGVVEAGQAFLSLGTSGVLFVATDAFRPSPEAALHAFCHALPGRWHQMAVMLSAASAVDWAAQAAGFANLVRAVPALEAADPVRTPIFLPYLSGERTPHNDPHAKGAFFGLTAETSRGDLVRAALEGVAFAFAQGAEALIAAGGALEEISVVGGGSRLAAWGPILAAALGRPLIYRAGGELGGAYGAARLARLAATGEDPAAVCTPPPIARVVEPDPALAATLAPRRAAFDRLYPALKPIMQEL